MRFLVLAGLAAAIAAGAAAAQTTFAPAPHRSPPLLINHHGAARKPLRIITFVPSNYPNAYGLQVFGNGIAASKWIRSVALAYGFASGTSASGYQVTDMPKLTAHSKAATYQTYVWKQLKRLKIGAQPDKQTIFILYIPCKPPQALDSFGCVSHHPAIVPQSSEPQFTSLDSMAVVLGDPSSSTDAKTQTASHELAEAITDTGNGWFIHAANPDKPWLDVSPFVEDEGSGNIESADMASGSQWKEKFFSTSPNADTTYSYVRIYANRRSSLGGDPAVPSNPHPYYNVTTPLDWPRVTAGGAAKSVVLTGWSAKKIPAWTVTARVLSWEGSKGGTGSNPCTITGKTSWSVANGGTLTLKVKAKKGSAGKWCDVQLKSAAAPTSDGDYSHPWYVGFHIV